MVDGAALAACPVLIFRCLFPLGDHSLWCNPQKPQIAGERLDPGLKQIHPSSGQEEIWALPQEPLARQLSSPLTYLSVLWDRLCLCLLMRKSMLCISAGSSASAG